MESFIKVFLFVAILWNPTTVFAVQNAQLDNRPLYTQSEIDSGQLDYLMNEDKVTFNSIRDPNARFYDEQYFVGVRIDDGNHGEYNVWSHDSIAAKDGETYIIRAFIHNNAISSETSWKEDGRGVAHNTKVAFNLPQISDTKINVHGIISATNAVPQEIRDNIVFESENNQPFHLEYIFGSALLENNGIGSAASNNGTSGRQISDDIVKAKSGGTLIGYDALNGEFPGCYQFFSFVTIKVQVVYDYSTFTLNKTARLTDSTDDNWYDNLDAKIGDEVEYQIVYHNTSIHNEYNVTLIDKLPDNMEYIKDSTRLWNEKYPNGATNTDNTILTEGINIGNYAPDANAYVRFRVRIVDKNLAHGSNLLVNWVKGTVDYGTPNEMVLQDFANVTIQKEGGQLNFIQIIVVALTILLIICVILIACLWHKWRKLKKEFQSKNSDLE